VVIDFHWTKYWRFFLMSLIGGATAKQFGWQSTFLLPGIWNVFVASIAYFGIRNSQSEILVETKENNDNKNNDPQNSFSTPTKNQSTKIQSPSNSSSISSSISSSSNLSTPSYPALQSNSINKNSKSTENPPESFRTIFYEHLIRNWRLWILCLGSLFHDTARTGWADWGFIMLVRQKKMDSIIAGSCMLWFEVGGFLGGIVAGRISDRVFKGRRDLTNFIFSTSAAIGSFLFWQYEGTTYIIISVLVFFIGFSVQGPQNLLGLASSESTHKRAAGTALGILGAFAALGASLSGNPLSQLTTSFGLTGFCLSLMFSSMITSSCIALLMSFFPEKMEPIKRE